MQHHQHNHQQQPGAAAASTGGPPPLLPAAAGAPQPDGGDSGPLPALLAAFPAGCLLLRDSLAASGAFLLPWIAAGSLSQGHKVVFVSVAYSPAKHRAVLRKLGAPGVPPAGGGGGGSSSSIAFVAPAPAPAPRPQPAASASGAPGAAAAPPPSGAGRLRILYQQVEAAARQLLELPGQQQQQQQHHGDGDGGKQQQQQQHLTVVIDSLVALRCLAPGRGQADAFAHQLMALSEVLQVPVRLVLLSAPDVADDVQLVAALAARAHVVADVAPLEGRTAALDGSLSVRVRRAGGAGASCAAAGAAAAPPAWLAPGGSGCWFFRAGDTAVRWLRQVHGKELMA